MYLLCTGYWEDIARFKGKKKKILSVIATIVKNKNHSWVTVYAWKSTLVLYTKIFNWKLQL